MVVCLVETIAHVLQQALVPFLEIEAMGIFAQQALGYKVTEFIRVGNHLAEKANGEPALVRIVVDDIHHGEQRALALAVMFGPQ